MAQHRARKALTLVEVLVSVFIVSLVTSAMLMAFPPLFEGINLISQSVQAWEAARREMETLKSSVFDAAFLGANPRVFYDPADPAASTPVANPFTPAGVNQATGVYYVERMHNSANALLNDIVDVEAVVCFKAGRRVVGEDQNLNGVLDAGEDLDHNGKISSPVTLRTLIKSF